MENIVGNIYGTTVIKQKREPEPPQVSKVGSFTTIVNSF